MLAPITIAWTLRWAIAPWLPERCAGAVANIIKCSLAQSKVDLPIGLRGWVASALLAGPPPLGKVRHNASALAGQDKCPGSVRLRLRRCAVRLDHKAA